ncbi:MAG: FkbM family methyltransferase [Candidatus Omnitrophica bacterium]|nr:FkbM family methyltransferase [Candidatus Omnitrophota bacterium]
MFSRPKVISILNKFRLFNLLRWVFFWAHSFDKRKLAFYRQFVSPGDLCYDIGANIGQEIELFLRLGAKVVAVEPQEECFIFLKNIYRNNPNVVLINKALDSNSGLRKEMFISEANALSSLSLDFVEHAGKTAWKGYTWNGRQAVMTDTLDALIALHGVPVFCKIDVEGYEHNVIQGLKRLIPVISFESTPLTRESTFKVLDHLSGLGELKINWLLDPTFSKGPIKMNNPEWTQNIGEVKKMLSVETDFYGDVFVKMFERKK